MKKLQGPLLIALLGAALLTLALFQANAPTLQPDTAPQPAVVAQPAVMAQPEPEPDPDPYARLLGVWNLTRLEVPNQPQQDFGALMRRAGVSIELILERETVTFKTRQGQQLNPLGSQGASKMPYTILSATPERIEISLSPTDQQPASLRAVIEDGQLHFLFPSNHEGAPVMIFRRASANPAEFATNQQATE